MTLNLKDADPLKPVTVTVERSDELFTTRLNEFHGCIQWAGGFSE